MLFLEYSLFFWIVFLSEAALTNTFLDTKIDTEKRIFLEAKMIALRAVDVKTNFKDVCAKAFDGEVILISRPKNQNVVLLSEAEYNELSKSAYLAKTVSKTLKELRAMEHMSKEETMDLFEKFKGSLQVPAGFDARKEFLEYLDERYGV